MRLLKPLLAGAALLTLAAPALASAQPFNHDGGRDYQRDGGYHQRHEGFRHRDNGYRTYGYDYQFRHRHHHHHWDHRGW
jgi:hypothetical protein